MTTYAPGARRPPPPSAQRWLLLATLPEPGHQLWLDTTATAVIERWEVDGQGYEVVHALPWDWTTEPPRSVAPLPCEWMCPACGTPTMAATSDQLAQFIVGHACSAAVSGHRSLRVVPDPTEQQLTGT